jgi:hypothetical protein
VYAGHAAFALFAKSRRARISLALLVPVAFAPDWIEWILSSGSTVVTDQDRFLSHALVSVVPCALAVGFVYWLLRRGAGSTMADAATVCAVYLSHWAADFITGIKPTWRGGPTVGLMFYNHTWPEAATECALVLLCWWAYHRSLPPASRRREIGWLIPVSLIVLEIVSALLQQPLS